AMTSLDEPYWLGVQPIMKQRITGLRLIWPDDIATEDKVREVAANIGPDIAYSSHAAPMAMPAMVFGRTARRYAHLAVIDGG
ncbi:MAG: hypothetical protein MO852_12785, partial [Candidatus Devosia euplotis]|nr:hypothetical protein [Candidatus Devosia euplotis]